MIDDGSNDEDWYDDEDEFVEEEPARCPECGGPVHVVTGKCPACGYWFLETDRRAMWSGMDKPAWIKVTAAIVLLTIVVGLLAAGVAFL
jgi:ribosomal protein S27AE